VDGSNAAKRQALSTPAELSMVEPSSPPPPPPQQLQLQQQQQQQMQQQEPPPAQHQEITLADLHTGIAKLQSWCQQRFKGAVMPISSRGELGAGIPNHMRPQHVLNALVSPNLAKALRVRVPGTPGLTLQADHGGHQRPLSNFNELLARMQVRKLPFF